jgi:alginate production protein
VRARVASADDDLLLLGNIRPFSGAAISGELRPRGEILRNRDLDDATRDAEIAPELLALVGGLARFGALDVYAEVSARRQFFLDGGPALGAENEKNLLSLSQLYIRYQRSRGEWWWRVQVGRQRLTDPRQWYIYTKNLDTVHGLAGYKRWSIEGAYGRTLFNKQHFKSEQSRDNLLLRVSYALTHEMELSAFLLDRSDRTAVADSPRLFGVRAYGDIGRHLEFWIDHAWERGERGLTDDSTGRLTVVPIEAEAYDIGATFRPRWRLDPSLTASIAHGSGGDDEAADVAGTVQTAGTFRQSGFERNKGSYNGVVSFSYYGEVLDPELANLNVETLGLGLRPLRSLSFDLIYHDYKQDVLSRRRIHGSPIDAKPNGTSKDLGTEWDVVIGYEPSRLLELRVTAGRFRPGTAYDDSHEVASIFTLQTKLRF